MTQQVIPVGYGHVQRLAGAAEHLHDDCLISYGDILFRRFVLDALLDNQADIALAVDALAKHKDAAIAGRAVDLDFRTPSSVAHTVIGVGADAIAVSSERTPRGP